MALALALALAGLSLGARAAYAARPYSDQEILAAETPQDQQIQALRDQEVTQLRITLGRHAPADQRADLYLRLAELYLEGYRSEFLLEGRVHEKRLVDGEQDDLIDRSHSKPYLAKGLQACHDILALGIPYGKLDQVYYFMGFYSQELGRDSDAIRYFGELARKYPSSPLAGEAYLELGDAAYGKLQYRKAQGLYEQAARSITGDSLPRTLHKLAWTYYRTRQYDSAVDTLKKAIALSVKGGDKFLSLKEELLRDMAVFMTEGGKVGEAISYFQSVAGDKSYYPKALEKLGHQYEHDAQPDKAVQVYEAILKTKPDDDTSTRVKVKLFDLDLRRGRFNQALARISGPEGVKFVKHDDAETETAVQNLRAMIRRTATEHHESFRKHADRSALPIAELFYSAYLNQVLSADDPRHETPEIEMYLADVKRELGKSKEASDLYRRVVESRDPRYAKEAGALWTSSLADSISLERQKEAKASAGKPKASAPSALETEFVSASDELQSSLGETPDAREAALRAAQVLAGYRDTQKDAVRRVRKIVDRWPDSTQAMTAARLWLQLESDRGADGADDLKSAMAELEGNTKLMAADQAQGGGKLKAQLNDLETHVKVMKIASLEKSKDFAGAGKAYEDFANSAPKQELAEKAYANAVASDLKAGDWAAIDRVTAAWLKRFPKSGRADASIRGASTAALIQGQFDLAAGYFEKLGQSGDAPSLETAARVAEGSGDQARARKDRSSYLDLFAKSPDRGRVALALARSQEAAHLDDDAAKSYEMCMQASGELFAECGARLADLHYRIGNVDQAKALYKKVVSLAPLRGPSSKRHKKAAASSPFIGYAHYRLAAILKEEAKFDPLALPDAKLKTAISQRVKFLAPLSKACLSAVEAGGPWSVAALDLLASFAMDFSNEVDRIQPQGAADASALAAFHKKLSTISAPLKRKALATWSEAYAKAAQLGLLSPALPAIADHLADFGAQAPMRAQGVRSGFSLAGIALDGGSVGREKALARVRDTLANAPTSAPAWVDYGNLLAGEGKPLLATVAYDRALALDPRSAAAMNNRGAIYANRAEEDWLDALKADALFAAAAQADSIALAPKENRAQLLNYYRLFAMAKPLWQKALAQSPSAQADDGMAIALQGLGDAQAQGYFAKAAQAGAPAKRFAAVFHEAARDAAKGSAGLPACASRLKDIDSASVSGFEKEAMDRLAATCKGGSGT